MKKFKVAFIYGKWSVAIHGPFDLAGLYRTRGLTGSESAFFNVIKTLAERGHDIHVSCPVVEQIERPDSLHGARVIGTASGHDKPEVPEDCDAYIAWNEPDLLKLVPIGRGVRILNHQINDFRVFSPTWDAAVQGYVSVSRSHAENILAEAGGRIRRQQIAIIPNSIEKDFYPTFIIDSTKRRPGSIAFTSSPDRGLFRILEFFPEVKARVPFATLDVFYEWKKLVERVEEKTSLPAMRMRYVVAMIDKYGHRGENGLTMHGNVSNVAMADQLMRTRVFAYPCEPIRYTEGFSVGTMDACAAGCVPIISDADALPEIYGEVATIVRGKPGVRKAAWVEEICRALTDDEYARKVSERARAYALTYSRQNVTDLWEEYLSRIVRT